ncbi:hypothetical protein KY338_04015 [Candidatus Woesearchaeota archaeon]|nr:hypothetical protein [Candidatus Woesearchaeota archaeon]MBW3005479.1 hypothetical protein [Candidatus Woesearchaeota archaeon]
METRSLNDWIEDKGPDILLWGDLVIPGEQESDWLTSLAGIEKFNHLEKLVMHNEQNIIRKSNHSRKYATYQSRGLSNSAAKISDFTPLASENLQETLQSLELGVDCKLANLVFLENYKNLKSLDLSRSEVADFSALNSFHIKQTLEELYLSAQADIDRVHFLKRYKSLKVLHLDNCPISHPEGLDSGDLKDTLQELILTNTRLYDLLFLKGYKNLVHLNIASCGNIRRFTGLDDDSLKQTVEILDINDCAGLNNVSFLEGYKHLKILDISSCASLEDFSGLNSESLKETLEELDLSHNTGLRDVSFLTGYKKLRIINAEDCGFTVDSSNPLSPSVEQSRIDFSGLASESIKATVQSLNLNSTILRDTSFLDDYKQLEILQLGNCSIENFSGLDSLTVKETLRHLDISSSKALEDVNFLRDYQNLRVLIMPLCGNIKNYSGLGSDSLSVTLKYIDLRNNHKFGNKELSLLKTYQNLEEIDLVETPVTDISDLPDYEFAKNGSLKKIRLPDSINWTLIKNGKYANTEAVRKLKARGIHVDISGSFPYSQQMPSEEDLIRDLLTKAGFENETLVAKIKEYDASNELKGGFSSGIVLASNGVVVKVARKDICQNEKRIYDLELNAMRAFMPELKEYLELDNIGVMVLSNTAQGQSALVKSGFCKNPVLHNLYLMGIFHKEATEALKESGKEKGIVLPGLIYQTLQGEPHYESLRNPLSSFSRSELRRFRQNMPSKNLVKELGRRIEETELYLREQGDCVVHGDWKLENTKNGYVLDFGVSHLGKEIEDISYFLSHIDLQLNSDTRRQYLCEYIRLRSEHDEEFAADSRKHEEMHKYFEPVRLLQLSIFAGVRRKREQTQKNEAIRQYYLNELN